MLKNRYQVAVSPAYINFQAGRTLPHLRRQRGAFAVMTAVLIMVIVGFCGFAVDFGRLYNRKIELQTVADTIALAAAAELNGTVDGVDRALAAAVAAARNVSYNYNSAGVVWTDNAIRFSSAPSGSAWVDAGGARGQAQRMFYVEIDTSRLDEAHGRVNLALLNVLPGIGASTQTGSRAVAGRSTVNVMPLAICAMSETRGAPRGTELVEHGFRRGISYNLMDLNPNINSKGANFLINPVAPPGTIGTAVKSRLNIVEPFVCAGKLAMPQVTAGNISVEHDFPLSSVFAHINSRFGSYTAPCTPNGAPPDANVKDFTPSVALSWMTVKPEKQSAGRRTTPTQLFTLAELTSPDPLTTKPEMYGPLWIYARAAKYSSYSSSSSEPAAGYQTFSASEWSTLYSPASPQLKGSYPSPTPSRAITQPPPGGLQGVADRRVLNIPLLRCPVPAGSPAPAEVLAVARFYMTVPATQDELFGEFAGLARTESLTGQVELYP